MSAANGNGPRKRTLDAAIAARGRADLVSGLRSLSRRGPATPPGAQPAAGEATGAGAEAEEFCDLCKAPLAPNHRHLLHLGERRMLCACETCWSERSGEADYRPAGVRTEWLDDLELPDELWASFQVPIGLAFFMRTGDGGVYAFYPSPAGATESEIDEDAWSRLEQANPALGRLEPDCEALIVNRMNDPHQHVVAPIDECYRLVGMIKTSWEGISGGPAVEEAIGRFFAELRIQGAMAGRPDA